MGMSCDLYRIASLYIKQGRHVSYMHIAIVQGTFGSALYQPSRDSRPCETTTRSLTVQESGLVPDAGVHVLSSSTFLLQSLAT